MDVPVEANVTLAEAQRRRAVIAVELERIELEVARGSMASVDEMIRQFAEQLSACRTKLLGIPSKVAVACALATSEAEVLDIVQTAVEEALAELSGYRPDDDAGEDNSSGDSPSPPDGDDADGDAPATAPDSLSVVGSPSQIVV
jgi:hypothetical protein